MDIMDVSKGLHVRIKKVGVFYTLMDKPNRTLVPARCKDVNPILHGYFNYVRFMGEEYSLKFEPKVLET